MRRLNGLSGPPRSQRGFTLIELMVTIAVIGIAAAVVAPGFSKVLASGRSARAARGFVEVMRYARSEAMVRNRAMRIQFFPVSSSTGGTATVVASDTAACSGFATGLPDEVGAYTYDVTEKGTVSDVQFASIAGASDLCIKPSGELYTYPTLAVSPGVTLTVGVRKGGVLTKTRTIQILPNGNARVN